MAKDFGLSDYDASILTASRDIADYYLGVAEAAPDKKIAANWVMGEVSAAVNQTEGMSFAEAPSRPPSSRRSSRGSPTARSTRRVRRKSSRPSWAGEGTDVDAVIEGKGLKQISDAAPV